MSTSLLQGFPKSAADKFDASQPVPLEAVASNLEARLAMAPNYLDLSFVQKNYRMPAPPINEAARQDFVEKLHIPRSHPKADEATRLIADLLEVLCTETLHLQVCIMGQACIVQLPD